MLERPFTRRTFGRRAISTLVAASLSKAALGQNSLVNHVDEVADSREERIQHAPLAIGFLVYPHQDQMDFTGPYEVLSRIPDATMHVVAKSTEPFRDMRGLILTPEMTLSDAPLLDALVVPGGVGQQDLMEDATTLSFIKKHVEAGRHLMSVCTGALLCGAAGVLRGRRATTHWTALKLLPYFGAVAEQSRVVVDGNYISCAGVTAGIDGALELASMLRGDRIAQGIQLVIEYDPKPGFHSGTPQTAPQEVLHDVLAQYEAITSARTSTAHKIAAQFSKKNAL